VIGSAQVGAAHRRGLDRTRRDWVELGRTDPLWAVLVTPKSRGDNWDVSEFLATGRAEVDAVLDRVRDLGLSPASGRVLDFGCGAGRLTQALARHFDDAVGVDVSAPMVKRARMEDTYGRCRFVHNERADLAVFDDASFDVAYSSLVLQHIPTALAMGYLSEMMRVVVPGGVVTVQVASHPDRSVKGRVAAALPLPVIRFVQRWVLRYPAPMDMYPMSAEQVEAAVAGRGWVVGSFDEALYGGHWVMTRYVIERR
jgi:SAM-dependent methyltransferase